MILDDLSAKLPATVDDAGRVRTVLYQAKHFVMDAASVEFCSALATQHGDLIDELAEFALQPFETMTVSMRYPNGQSNPDTLTLFDRGEFKMFLKGEQNTEISTVPGWFDPADHAFILNPKVPSDVLGRVGPHYRFMLAFFLLMAQPRAYQVNFNEARTSVRAGKRCRYYARSEVVLNLTDVAEFRRGFYTGARSTPRRHGVRGHFFHLGGDRSCEHAWSRIEDRENAWRCYHCARRRYWRKSFERGDAGKGFVRQTYLVTAGEER